MTVLDSSVVVDYLAYEDSAAAVRPYLDGPTVPAAPDVLVFEVVSALRRLSGRGEIPVATATSAVGDLGDLRLQLVSSLPLRARAWELRHNVRIGDGLFVALAEALDEPLVVNDEPLAREIAKHSRADVVLLAGSA